MKQTKRKMTKQEIKDAVAIRALYFIVELVLRNFAFSIIMGMIPFIVHFIPMNNLIYMIIDMTITFVIIEIIFQQFIYRYAYKNIELINKNWWLEFIKIVVIPYLLWYCWNMIYYFVLYVKNFQFNTEIETLYMIFVHGTNLIPNGRQNAILAAYSSRERLDYFNSNMYLISFLICSSIRVFISAISIYTARKNRLRDRQKLTNNNINL